MLAGTVNSPDCFFVFSDRLPFIIVIVIVIVVIITIIIIVMVVLGI